MTTRSIWRSGLWSLTFAVTASVLGMTSCAQERDPINRVQANALAKSFFVGALDDANDNPIFLTRNFVVDASEAQSLVGISTASGLERIRWDVTEDMLFARRAYSVTNGDDKGTGAEANGTIVAAYKIQSHFDIRNAYNSSTGEELNVIEENTSDRPWSQREYFRVDWSQNLVDSPVWTTMFFGKTFGDIKVTPVSYFESDPQAEDAPHFDTEEGYFDITSHFLVEPEQVSYYGYDVPLCLLMGFMTGSAIYSCDPQEAVLRSSYWRLDRADPDDDFEPLVNTEAPLDVVGNPGGIGDSASIGIVSAPIETYDPAYGFTDVGLRRYMNIHNLWKQSHQTRGTCETSADCEAVTGRGGSVCLASGTCSIPCDYQARGDRNGAVDSTGFAAGNGTDDQCENASTGYEGSEGAQCSARNRCTIPYRDRDARTITYHVNRDMPDALQDQLTSKRKFASRGATEDLAATWNQALSLAVARAREVECRRTGDPSESADAKRTRCHAQFFRTDDQNRDQLQMVSYGGWGVATPKDDTALLAVCHNPVRSYDPKSCGEVGATAREGDLRKNFLIYWPYDTQAPYGGIGNWRADPVTGQIVGAAATTIGPSATRAAGRVRDLVLVALGKLNLTDITEGTPAALFEKTLRDGRTPQAFSAEELQRRVAASDVTQLAKNLSFKPEDTQLAPHLLTQQLKMSLSASSGLSSQQLVKLQAIAKPLLGTDLEAQMLDPGWLVDAVGFDPSSLVNGATLATASPLQGQDAGYLSMLDRRMHQQLGLRGVCHLDAGTGIGNPDVAGMGQYFANKYPGLDDKAFAERVYEDLWVEAYKGIQLHEVGHSLGLLHNFTSSYDAMNYDPQYWQLRTQEGQVTADCGGQPRDPNAADSCMGPRYLDPETADELGRGSEPRPGINYFGHTSSMEYQVTRFFESVGLGQYDVMAMGMLYGRVLETFDARAMSPADQTRFIPLTFTQLSDDISLADKNVHYTELGRLLTLFDPSRCREATAEEKAHAEWRIVHGKICAPPPKDHGHWDDFVDVTEEGVFSRLFPGRKMRVPAGSTAAAGNLRWQYRFGGDQQNAYIHVNPSDAGADAYEVTRETIAKNDYDYPFNYFRSKRRGWLVSRLPAQASRTYFERLRSYHWSISFTNAFFNDLVPKLTFEDIKNDDNGLRPYLIAQSDMFDAIARSFLAPEPGNYAQSVDLPGNVFDLADSNQRSVFTLDASNARFLAPSFDSTASGGGSWNYSEYLRRGGNVVEKLLAARALTDGTPTLSSVSRDIYLDSRGININFRTDMPRAVDRLLGGILAEDWATVGPYIESTATPDVKVLDFQSDTPAPLSSRARQLFPDVGYNQQLPAMIFAFLFGSMSDDITLSTKMRIWLQGSVSGELDVPENEQVRFRDPQTGITYVARRYGNESLFGKDVDRGIGSRMLIRANELLSQVYETETDADGATVFNEFGEPELTLADDALVERADNEDAQAAFRKYVTLIDSAVRIGTLVGHGPLL